MERIERRRKRQRRRRLGELERRRRRDGGMLGLSRCGKFWRREWFESVEKKKKEKI